MELAYQASLGMQERESGVSDVSKRKEIHLPVIAKGSPDSSNVTSESRNTLLLQASRGDADITYRDAVLGLGTVTIWQPCAPWENCHGSGYANSGCKV